MITILALDVATTTGWAFGSVGGVPAFGSVKLGNASHTDYQVFAAALDWLADHLEKWPTPDSLILEAMLPPDAMRNATSRAVRDRLGGLHGCFKGVAHRYGIGEISTASVGDVRAHFIGDRSLRRDQAKRATVIRCQQLGWNVADDNAADALALWDYACCLVDPKLGIRRSPLFARAAE